MSLAHHKNNNGMFLGLLGTLPCCSSAANRGRGKVKFETGSKHVKHVQQSEERQVKHTCIKFGL